MEKLITLLEEILSTGLIWFGKLGSNFYLEFDKSFSEMKKIEIGTFINNYMLFYDSFKKWIEKPRFNSVGFLFRV